MKLVSPYPADLSGQYKGNLHSHTTRSDGTLAPQKVIDMYAEAGYHFLMLSDHDTITDDPALNNRSMTLIRGYEITASGSHMLHVHAEGVLHPTRDRQPMIDAVIARGGLAIMNHPNWGEDFIHCAQEELERLNGYVGVEIYNGVSERAEGAALATDRWDILLSRGRCVWGFGNDDLHEPEDFGITWNMVFSENASEAALLEALRTGSFYVSTGVRIEHIAVHGNEIEIDSPDTQCFRVVRDHGMILATVEGSQLRYTVPERYPLSYVRVECYGAGVRMAWTQPFWVE